MKLFPAFVAVTVLGTTPAPPTNFVPGEVMVKFVSGSEADQAVSDVSQRSPLRFKGLAPVVEQLEASTQLPLTVSQVTSGNWLVLKIEVEKLCRGVADRLRGYQNVAQAEILEEDNKYIGYQPPKKISVTFAPGSMEAQTVSSKLSNQGENHFSNLMSRLQQRADSPLTAEVTRQKGLVLQVDLKSLTLTLQDRLKSLPSVEAIQLNYVMTAF